jgi:hypothetical protein
MMPKPPRAAAWLIELFAPIESADSVLGDLEEEFAGRFEQSGRGGSYRWYWRQAVLTSIHLSWGSFRSAPWSTGARALASLVVGLLLYVTLNRLVAGLVSSLPIYEYETSVWSWRAAALVRFVALPIAIGWSIAAVARGREMIVTMLVVAALLGMLLLALAVNGRFFVLVGQRLGLFWALIQVLELFVVGALFPLSVLVGGSLRRMQQMRTGSVRL